MNEIIEIYTKSRTFNNQEEIEKEVNRIRTEVTITSFEELARYVCEGYDGKNLLVELQVSTKWCRENDIDDYIDIVLYEFEGDLNEYMADTELCTIKFNGVWEEAIDKMKSLAEKYLSSLKAKTENDVDIVKKLRNKQSRDNRALLDEAAAEIERLRKENEILLNQNSVKTDSVKRISVSVPLGELTAEIGGDPENYPELFVYLKRKDGIEIDLVAVAQNNVKEEDLKAYLYDDTSTDSYGRTFTWHEEALLIEEE